MSPRFRLRFPSLAELYEGVERGQDSVRSTLEEAAVRAQELQKALDRIARQAPAPAGASPRSFERQEEMRSALERQQDLSRRVGEAAERLREGLGLAVERRAFDERLVTKLRELAEIMSQIESPEFRDALRRLQESLESLAPRPAEAGLRDWQRRSQEMLRNVERTLELLKQLRQEERLQALARRTAELKTAQDARNQELAERPTAETAAERTARAAAQQRDAGETERLAREARALGQEMPEAGATEELDRAAAELEQQAAPAQREAARAMEQDRRGAAQRSGQRASQSLGRAAAQLAGLSNSVQEARAQVDVAAVRRAAQDLLSLQRAAEANLDSDASGRERGDRASDLAEGTARVADSLWALSKRSPFIGRDLAEALGRAIGGLQQSSRQLGQGDRAGGEAAGRTAAGALLEAVLGLRRTEDSMCQNPGQGQPSGSVPMRMDQLGQDQGALNDRTRRLSQRLSEQARLSAGDRDQLERMAAEQARLRDELQRIEQEDRDRRQLLGQLDRTGEEMKQVETALRQGRFGDEVEQRQQHILSRLLDAQRSVNRRDFDPQRESRPGEDVRRGSPAPLPGELLRESDRLRLDLLKAQADRYPAQYRAFVEAYLRALNGGRCAMTAALVAALCLLAADPVAPARPAARTAQVRLEPPAALVMPTSGPVQSQRPVPPLPPDLNRQLPYALRHRLLRELPQAAAALAPIARRGASSPGGGHRGWRDCASSRATSPVRCAWGRRSARRSGIRCSSRASWRTRPSGSGGQREAAGVVLEAWAASPTVTDWAQGTLAAPGRGRPGRGARAHAPRGRARARGAPTSRSPSPCWTWRAGDLRGALAGLAAAERPTRPRFVALGLRAGAARDRRAGRLRRRDRRARGAGRRRPLRGGPAPDGRPTGVGAAGGARTAGRGRAPRWRRRCATCRPATGRCRSSPISRVPCARPGAPTRRGRSCGRATRARSGAQSSSSRRRSPTCATARPRARCRGSSACGARLAGAWHYAEALFFAGETDSAMACYQRIVANRPARSGAPRSSASS